MGKRDRLVRIFRTSSTATASPLPSTTAPKAPIVAIQNVPSAPGQTIASASAKSSSVNSTPNSGVVLRNQVIQRAIQEHLSQLTGTEQDVFRSASQQLTEQNVLDQVNAYDQNHRATSKLRPHSESLSRFFTVLNKFLDSIAVGIQANPDVSAIVIGLVRVVVTTALGFVGFFDKLADMASRFGDYLETLSTYSKSAAESNLLAESLVKVYVDLFTFWHAARQVFVDSHGNARRWTSWRIFWRVQWLPFEAEFATIDARMKHHLEVLSHAARAINLELTFAVRSQESDLLQREIVREREQFLTWLSDFPFEDIHSNIYAKKHPGTGDWLLQRPEYQRWFNSQESSILWLYGKPGAGKSVLASNVVEHITSQCALDDRCGIGFVYYQYDSQQKQDIVFMLAAMIKQICRGHGSIPEGFLRIKQDAYPRSHIANIDSFLKAAEHYHMNRVFLIIDALDECPKSRRPEMLRALREIVVCVGIRIKLFVSSRPETDIEDAFTQLQVPRIKIEAQSLERDINQYVQEEIDQLVCGADGRILYLKNTAMQKEIVDTLCRKAEGMFLWVDLQLTHLCEVSESRNDLLIKEALLALPTGLEATYQRSLTQIYQQNEYKKQIAVAILNWTMYANRPLTTKEVHEVLSNEIPQYKHQDLDHKFLLGTCANLVDIEEVAGTEYLFSLRLIHFSVKEYMTNPAALGPQHLLPLQLQSKEIAQSTLAKTCIGYLLARLANAKPCVISHHLSLRLSEHPFIWYAATSFDIHTSQSTLSEALFNMCEILLGQSNSFLSSLWQLRSIPYVQHQNYTMPLYWENFQSHKDIANDLIVIFSSQLFGMEAFKHHWNGVQLQGHLLPLACRAGMKHAVEHLLALGISVDARDRHGTAGLYQPMNLEM